MYIFGNLLNLQEIRDYRFAFIYQLVHINTLIALIALSQSSHTELNAIQSRLNMTALWYLDASMVNIGSRVNERDKQNKKAVRKLSLEKNSIFALQSTLAINKLIQANKLFCEVPGRSLQD